MPQSIYLQMKSSKLKTILILVFIFSGVLAGVLWFKDPSGTGALVQSGTQDRVEVLSRKLGIDFNKLKGKRILLHFWASWCPPCVDEIPLLYQRSKMTEFPKDTVILAVSLDEERVDALKLLPGFKDDSPTFILAMDSTKRLAESYGSYQLPETFLIDQAGELKEKWAGPKNWLKINW